VIKWRPSRPMLVMEVFTAALYLAHSKLNSSQGIRMLPELRTESGNDLVSIGTFGHQKCDDHSLIILHQTEFETSTNVVQLKKSV
jgi:hypothetical protein